MRNKIIGLGLQTIMFIAYCFALQSFLLLKDEIYLLLEHEIYFLFQGILYIIFGVALMLTKQKYYDVKF